MRRLDTNAQPARLGVQAVGDGVDVAVWSRHAEAIDLCVFDAAGERETGSFRLPCRSGDVWHGRLPGAGPGLVYGLRAHGAYAPLDGHRFNPNKLLLDPCARELVGAFRWHDAVLGYVAGHPDGTRSFDHRDSAPFVPKARVPAALAPGGDRPPKPGRPWSETVLYEAHVRGFSMLAPGVPAPLRGTIGALAHPASIAHLARLGVTAVELLPVAAWLDELHLASRGLSNYWGYNPIAFFAMQPALAGPRGLAAMVDAVDALHEAGIEVILDVVFNHTGEGDERGPTLSLRGLDNAAYYLPDPLRPGGYRNLSGCGNTLAAHDPAVGALIVDALRFWADEVGVDGFRFDLASAIARDAHGRFDSALPWIRALREDPVLARCKLIAEGWDCEGHFVGGFPAGWAEWNDRYRDDIRRFWLGRAHGVGALATRLAGSSDLFGAPGRGPASSIDYVTAHDGFTLADTVSYRRKRNHANGEDDRDGHAHEVAGDDAPEGPVDDPELTERRARRMRAMLATLMLSRGVPMLRAGDEFGATQHGNNNAYCQDGPLTWLAWPADAGAVHAPAAVAGADLRPLLSVLARLRADFPALRGEHFLHGHPSHDAEAVPDVVWLDERGDVLRHEDWHDGARRVLALQLDAGVPRPGAAHDRLWIGLVATDGTVTLRLPATSHADGWIRLLDTGDAAPPLAVGADRTLVVQGPAVVVCAAGDAARAERARWTEGLPPVAFVAAGSPSPALELVRADGDPPAGLVIEPASWPARDAVAPPRERLPVPGPQTVAVEARTGPDGRRLLRYRATLPGPSPAGTYAVRLVEPGPSDPAADAADADIADHRAADRGVDRAADRALRKAPADPGDDRSAGGSDARARDARDEGRLVVAPPRCWLPPELQRPQGAWALSAQLYGLHGARTWGIGDFEVLGELGERAGAIGAAGLLVSPLHAASLGWPDRGSPYSPSSRIALAPLFVSLPRAADGFATPLFDAWVTRDDTGAAIDAVRAADPIDLPAVGALKRAGFERLWSDFRATVDTARTRGAAREFDTWRARHAARLRPHLLFEALAEHHGVADRRAWPAGFAHPDDTGTLAFERAHPERIAFHAFLQWLADRQWREAGERARAAGATIGPIADLAVGADPAGADSWSRPALVADDHEIGAPPDAFAADGQAWGLPPWRPEALADAGHAPLAELLRATMAGAGGLRIDHVMALERLFWVPRGRRPVDGAYVRYPLEDLLRVVATESHAQRCLVIGEDLGTVRPGLRERLATAAVLSYKVAWFERAADGTLADPASLPPLAAVCASTHDLPTIDGWVDALDVAERERLGAIDADAAARQRAERRDDLARVEAGLARAGLHGGDLCDRLHRWLAASGARLAIVQLEDVAGLHRQPNLPGTPDEPPNWRQRLPHPVDALASLPRWRRLAAIFAQRRAGPARHETARAS